MESIGDWIYLVLILIFAASGMFGSKSKKKRPTVVLGGPEYEPGAERTSWEMPEDADASQSKKAKMPEPAPIPKAEPSIGPLSSRTSAALENTAGEGHSILEDVDFKDAEELRKAVIYSEILNRKYY